VIAVDTNVLLRWLLGDNERQKMLADELFASLTREDPGFITSVTLAELCWVLRSVYRFPKSQVLDTVEDLLTTDELAFDDDESMWTALLQARAGADFADALIANTALLFCADGMVTFDRGAAESLGLTLLS
jgi:predicted nucleic-acid-binding protein